MQSSLIKIGLQCSLFFLSLCSLLYAPGFQSQSSKSHRKMIMKGEKKHTHIQQNFNTVMGACGMSKQVIEYMDVGHGRVKPGASIPSVGKLQLGQLLTHGGRSFMERECLLKKEYKGHKQI